MQATIAPSEQAFSDAWEAFFRAVRRQRAGGGCGPGGPLTVPQFHLLEPLVAEGPSKTTALAHHAGVSAPTATRMLDALERQGHVERRPSPQDRRCVLVELTETGRRAVHDTRSAVDAMHHRIAALLDDEERAQATRLLQRLADAMEDLA